MHATAQPVRTEYVHEQVGEGERDRGGLLHARETPERPLAVELFHPHAALRRQVRHRVHARVLALVRARPPRESQRERGRVRVPAVGRAVISRAFSEAPLEPVRAVAGRGESEWAVAGIGSDDGEDDEAERENVKPHGCCCLASNFFF